MDVTFNIYIYLLTDHINHSVTFIIPLRISRSSFSFIKGVNVILEKQLAEDY
jgi:hypothetical protein